MDYCNRLRYIQFIIFVTFIAAAHCKLADEDIILTPKETSQVQGKTLYFRPLEDLNSEPGVRVPWERALKHLTYLTLYGMPYEKNQLSDDKVNYQKFMNASYIIRTDHIVTNFGNIITLAAGQVEKLANNTYSFIESKPISKKEKFNNKNIIAQWEVQKIRYRVAENKFRYEIKFSIDPYNPESTEDAIEGRQIKDTKRVTRSFILRDFDYPDSFLWFDQHVAQRRIDNNRRYLERLHHFNEVFMQPFYIDSSYYTSDNPNVQNLNIGEFLNGPIQRRIPTYSQYITPTTYRPKYHVKFSKPPFSYEAPIQQNTLPIKATHVHHHYFVRGNKYENVPRPYNGQDLLSYDINPSIRPPFGYIAATPPPIKHQIPTPPNFSNHLSQTAVPVQLTSPIIQPPSQEIQSQYTTAAPNRNFVHSFTQKVFYDVPQNLAAQRYQFTQQPQSNGQPFLYNFQVTRAPIASQQEYLDQIIPTQPFVESPREENIRYSEPDPLYKNEHVNDQQIVRPQEQIAPKKVNQPSDEVRFEGPTQQEADSEPEWIRPGEQNLNSFMDQQSETITNDFNSGIDVDHREEVSPIVDSNTEQNQISDINYINENKVQMLPPQFESEDESTTLRTETTNEESSQESIVEIKPADKVAKASVDAPSHKTAVNYVEVTHLGAPVDPPVVTDISVSTTTSVPSHTSTTTQRSVNSYEVVPTSSSPSPNLLESKNNNKITKAEAHYKPSSERPVLKWKPKRPRINLPSSKTKSQSDTTYIIAKTTVIQRPLKIASNESNLSIERIPDEDTIQKIFTYHPIAESIKRGISNTTSAPTKRSYSTSVSVKVGTSKEVPLEPTVPVPHLELFKAQLEALHTNSSLINFFKASDRNEKPVGGEDAVERAITSSIVKHATSLDN